MIVTIPTLMWLLPVVFMIHDFEEVIMARPWYRKNAPFLKVRFPRLARSLSHMGSLSTSAFALAVAEEFAILSAITLVCVEYGLYSIWAGVLIGFFIHLLYHIGSFIMMGRYVPFIITSVVASVYSASALFVLNDGGYLAWGAVAAWALIAIVVIAVNLLLVLKVATWFDKWLSNWSP